MPNFPVFSSIALDQEMVIEKVSDDEMYVCIAESPGIKRSDPHWQIKKVYNSGIENPIMRFANNDRGYNYKQSDWNNSSVITYPDPT